MAISITKYIDITSGVGAGAAVPQRELIGRLFTENPLLPTQSFVEFTDLTDVGTYFGTSSEEYKRASFYFSFISKNITQAQKISFARWVNVDTAPLIFGSQITTTLSDFQAITNGAFTLTIGIETHVIGGIDFSGATSLANVASDIQIAIRAASSSPVFLDAIVAYDALTGSFNFTGGQTADSEVISISVSLAGADTEIMNLIGWGSSATFSYGVPTESITDTLTQSDQASDNFGSFLFLPSLTIDQIVEGATWNKSNNIKYQYHIPVSVDNESSYSTALFDIGGCSLTLSVTEDEYPEMAPMILLASTDYNSKNSVQNYMYQQFNLTPSVTDTATSNSLDTLRINYYGRTQTAGQFIDFFQTGVLMGLATDPLDMNVYANEQWLKDAATAALMNLFLSINQVPANNAGVVYVLNTLQEVIDQALSNGTISPGKSLSTVQKLFITSVTGNPNAWYQVKNIGYWRNCQIVSFVDTGNVTKFKAVYTLVYSKDDVIRKIEGSHDLI